MGEMAEDRIYADRRGKRDVYVGAGLGVTLVAISDDRVGRFRLLRGGRVHSVAADETCVVIATDEGIYRATHGEETFEDLGFGPAVAVGLDGEPTATGPDGDPIAAGSDGNLARYDGEGWQSIGQVTDVSAIDGEWVAAPDGAYRLTGSSVERTGLTNVRDVAAGDVPLAGTDDGLYAYGDGSWTREQEGAFSALASDGQRSHAVGETGLFERGDDAWQRRSLPVDEPIVDVGYAQGPIAVTDFGTILVDPPAAKDGAEGWRSRSLGLTDVTSLAVAGSTA
ncbi:HVO_0234 family beta-propeller protein [Halorhabdus salina]|uniref:HVO_0234 family beta-propeller protein n=1 Tax=Halorhabdus salina TaxID=2750670 RepID=UPI0015EF94F3|nr:hypothetical protein [Halorhabdus salina]